MGLHTGKCSKEVRKEWGVGWLGLKWGPNQIPAKKCCWRKLSKFHFPPFSGMGKSFLPSKMPKYVSFHSYIELYDP